MHTEYISLGECDRNEERKSKKLQSSESENHVLNSAVGCLAFFHLPHCLQAT